MNELFMSSTAFSATLHLLNVPGTCMLPKPENHTETFLQGRNELCEKGLAELDFDGKITPDRSFARLLYDISNAVSAIRLERPGATLWYLLAPTEMLFIGLEKETVHLQRRKATTLLPWIREMVLPVKSGILTTVRAQKTRQAFAEEYLSEDMAWAKEIVKHLALFFGKEEKNA